MLKTKKFTKRDFLEVEYALKLAEHQMNESIEHLTKVLESSLNGLANLDPALTIKLIEALHTEEIPKIKELIKTNDKLHENYINDNLNTVPDYLKIAAE